MVVCGVPHKAKLITAETWVNAHGVRTVVMDEPDDGMGFTAFCTEPVYGEKRAVFKRLQVLNG